LQEGCAYPFKELSAGGLAFKLAQALLGTQAFEYFDLATLSTVADLAPLRGENRILVREGLRQLSERRRMGIKALTETASLRAPSIKTSHVGFVLGPRINASGRMSSALTALRLLLTSNEREARSLAQVLEMENRARREAERRVVNEAVQEVERTHNFTRDRIVVVAREGWHAGVIGIVASRLAERYHRPALVIALERGLGKGSARSIKSFHLFNALEAAREFLIEFGGHEQAAGFSVEEKKIPDLRKRLNEHSHTAYPPEIFMKSIDIDLEISLADLSSRLAREIELLEPFGVGNPKPVFLTRGLSLRNKGRGDPAGRPYGTRRVWATDGRSTYEVTISERAGSNFEFETGRVFDLVYTVAQKSWEGESTTILEAKDAKPSE
jgi:single-stranded-DNA-specific exonuclease